MLKGGNYKIPGKIWGRSVNLGLFWPDIYIQIPYFRFLKNFRFHRKTPVSESLFNKVVGLNFYYRTPQVAASVINDITN